MNTTYAMFVENRTSEEVEEFDRMLLGDLPDVGNIQQQPPRQQVAENALMAAFLQQGRG